jgi:uncharacterized RDD family membrane protein YckC
MVAENSQLDTTIEIVTPENIAFQYRLAGPFRRLPAYLIDLVIRVAVCVGSFFLLAFVFGLLGIPGVGLGMFMVFWFGMAWFYGGLFETFWNGQTPGKRAMQIRVLTVDGQPINAMQAVLRNVLRAIDSQPVFLYQAGLITAAMNNRFQRLGVLACGTIVVIEQRKRLHGVVRVVETEALELAGQIPATFQPSRTLTHALALYVGRRQNFPWTRRMEIAHHLAGPLRERFDLPEGTNPDLLLCALYHRTFITDRADDHVPSGESPVGPAGQEEPSSPFAEAAEPVVAAEDKGGQP